MDMSKSNDLIKAKTLVPWPQQQYRSWELGLQMVNHKTFTDFHQPNWMNSDHIFKCIAKANIYWWKLCLLPYFFLYNTAYAGQIANN